MNNYTRKWRHFNSKWKHSENTYLLVWWQHQTTDSIRKIWKSKVSGQTTDSVRKIRKSKASDRVRGFLMCKGISRVNPWWYDSHVMCVLLSFQLSQMILYSAGFESYIRENFWFFALQIRIVCCLANARRQQECIPSYFILFVSPDSWKHASNYSQYWFVSDTNKPWKFDFGGQLDLRWNIGTKLLTTAIKLQNKRLQCSCYFSYLLNFQT